jgi:hypothetical protein
MGHRATIVYALERIKLCVSRAGMLPGLVRYNSSCRLRVVLRIDRSVSGGALWSATRLH